MAVVMEQHALSLRGEGTCKQGMKSWLGLWLGHVLWPLAKHVCPCPDHAWISLGMMPYCDAAVTPVICVPMCPCAASVCNTSDQTLNKEQQAAARLSGHWVSSHL